MGALPHQSGRVEWRAGYGFGDGNGIDPHIGWVLAIGAHRQRALEAAARVAAVAENQLLRLGTAIGTSHSIAGPPRSPLAARIGYWEWT